ncbi:MAG: hypothetical protein ACI4EA_01305 [Candidatus Ornithomonoglobus sp.]
MVVTFCGHGKEKYSDDIKKRLYSTVEMLINQGAGELEVYYKSVLLKPNKKIPLSVYAADRGK